MSFNYPKGSRPVFSPTYQPNNNQNYPQPLNPGAYVKETNLPGGQDRESLHFLGEGGTLIQENGGDDYPQNFQGYGQNQAQNAQVYGQNQAQGQQYAQNQGQNAQFYAQNQAPEQQFNQNQAQAQYYAQNQAQGQQYGQNAQWNQQIYYDKNRMQYFRRPGPVIIENNYSNSPPRDSVHFVAEGGTLIQNNGGDNAAPQSHQTRPNHHNNKQQTHQYTEPHNKVQNYEQKHPQTQPLNQQANRNTQHPATGKDTNMQYNKQQFFEDKNPITVDQAANPIPGRHPTPQINQHSNRNPNAQQHAMGTGSSNQYNKHKNYADNPIHKPITTDYTSNPNAGRVQ
jgi:hypothetical protein